MADIGPNDPPPPYSMPGLPEMEPPPYSPPQEGAAFKTDTGVPAAPSDAQGAAVPTTYQTYGTETGNARAAYDPKTTGSYPPGAPPCCGGADGTHMTSSTTLLVSRERKPPSFFLLALMTCLCFSPLFGILAIIFSCLSDSAWVAGDKESAQRYSQVAIALSVVGIITSVITVILIFATGAIRFHYV